MNNPEDKELFDLFGSRLTDSDKPDAYGEENWDRMERLLDGETRKKTSIVWLYRIISVAAAVLLMFMVFNVFKLKVPEANKIAKSPVNKPVKSVEKKFNNKENKAIIAAVYRSKVPHAGISHALVSSSILKRNKSFFAANNSNIRFNIQSAMPDSFKSGPVVSVILPPYGLALDQTISPGGVDTLADLLRNKVKNNKKTTLSSLHNTHRMAFTILAASDANGVNSFSSERGGTNLTAQFSLKLTRRLSISTGAAYAYKPYQTSFSSYKSNSPDWWGRMFSTNNKPNNVVANCKVLDVPLNVNYELYSKGRNSFALGGGLSSYFMLSEKYNFSFADPALSSRNIQINNQNQHIFSILNLTSTYQRQVNSNLGVVVQPYMKLPLSRIGFGQVDLKSAGVAVGFSWNINSFKGR